MHRSAKVAAGAVLLATGLAVAGCQIGGASASAPTTSLPTQGGRTANGAVINDAYSTTEAAKSAKTTITTQIGGDGTSIPVTATGVINFADSTADLTESLPAGLGSAETRFVNGYLYEKLPAAVASKLSGGKAWIAVNLNAIVQQQTGATLDQLSGGPTTNPSDTLSYLRGASDTVQDLGQDTVDGTSTEHYAVTIDLNRAVANSPARVQQSTKALEQELGGSTLPAQVWIDGQGLLRKVTFNTTLSQPLSHSSAPATPTPASPTSTANPGKSGATTIAFTETFSDFGTPATVTAPSADQVTDITSRIEQH